MTDTSFPQYELMPLVTIAEKLQQDYYKTLEVFCTHIVEYCNDLKAKRLPEASLNYVLLCDALASDLQKYLLHRNAVVVPYLKELSEKETTNHNCGNCSGRCELNHTVRLMDMKASLKDMNEILYRIKTAALLEGKITDTGLRSLHSKMQLVSTMISELIQIEEAHLLPGVEKAQRNIHVAS